MKYLIPMKLKCFNIQHTSLNLKSQTIGGNKNLSTTITAIHVDEHLNSSVQYTYICIYVLKSAVGTWSLEMHFMIVLIIKTRQKQGCIKGIIVVNVTSLWGWCDGDYISTFTFSSSDNIDHIHCFQIEDRTKSSQTDKIQKYKTCVSVSERVTSALGLNRIYFSSYFVSLKKTHSNWIEKHLKLIKRI